MQSLLRARAVLSLMGAQEHLVQHVARSHLAVLLWLGCRGLVVVQCLAPVENSMAHSKSICQTEMQDQCKTRRAQMQG